MIRSPSQPPFFKLEARKAVRMAFTMTSSAPTAFEVISSSVMPGGPMHATDDRRISTEDEGAPERAAASAAVRVVKKRKATGTRRPRRKITYVSKHFMVQRLKTEISEDIAEKVRTEANPPSTEAALVKAQAEEGTRITVMPQSRIFFGLNVDELSSDSDLTDVPDDIGPDPFLLKAEAASVVRAVKIKKELHPTKSPYFPAPHRHRPTFLSTLPFPPLSHDRFGLMQERLAHDPFRLLIATIFLNKTPGERAMPIFYQLMAKYPTPADLAAAEVSDITSIIYVLGFQNQRARKCVEMAKTWVERPPEVGKRYKKQNYPLKGDGRDVKVDEVLDDEDERVAWEISHLPGLGPYSHDSWRMFCRDELRGKATSWNGEGADDPAHFESEWKRVIPLDKELRAWLTWMWLKEGWVWNKETGHRTKASEELLSMARGGGIVVEEQDSNHLTVKSLVEEKLESLQDRRVVEHTAGDFLPTDLKIQ
jgi:endonuclease III